MSLTWRNSSATPTPLPLNETIPYLFSQIGPVLGFSGDASPSSSSSSTNWPPTHSHHFLSPNTFFLLSHLFLSVCLVYKTYLSRTAYQRHTCCPLILSLARVVLFGLRARNRRQQSGEQTVDGIGMTFEVALAQLPGPLLIYPLLSILGCVAGVSVGEEGGEAPAASGRDRRKEKNPWVKVLLGFWPRAAVPLTVLNFDLVLPIPILYFLTFARRSEGLATWTRDLGHNSALFNLGCVVVHIVALATAWVCESTRRSGKARDGNAAWRRRGISMGQRQRRLALLALSIVTVCYTISVVAKASIFVFGPLSYGSATIATTAKVASSAGEKVLTAENGVSQVEAKVKAKGNAHYSYLLTQGYFYTLYALPEALAILTFVLLPFKALVGPGMMYNARLSGTGLRVDIPAHHDEERAEAADTESAMYSQNDGNHSDGGETITGGRSRLSLQSLTTRESRRESYDEDGRGGQLEVDAQPDGQQGDRLPLLSAQRSSLSNAPHREAAEHSRR